MSETTGGTPMFICGPTTGCGKLTPMERIASGWIAPRNCVHCGKEWRRLPSQEITLTSDLLYTPATRREDATEPKTIAATACNTCGEQQNAAGYCTNKQCSRHGRRNDYLARREDAAGEPLYPKPASAEEAAAFAGDLESAPPSTIDDGFDWLDASNAEPILDPELRAQFAEQVQAMKTGSPFLKTLVLRYDKTVRALLAEHAAALSTAEREREELTDAMDSIYVERYGITYRELEERVRAVQKGEFLTHEEAMQRIRATLTARVPSGGEEGR